MQEILDEIGQQHFLTLSTVWFRLAPHTPLQEFFNATNEHRNWMFEQIKPQNLGARLFTPEEIARLPDNSADYEKLHYQYHGIEEIQALLAAKKPLVFLVWHHGAQQHGDYGIYRVFPQTAFFTHRTFQYGKTCSYPMQDRAAFSLVRMERFLSEGRPVSYYLDGPPLGNTIDLPLLGVPSKISTAPFKLFRSIEGLEIVPVTRYYRNRERAEFIFHRPLGPERLRSMTTPETVVHLLGLLEQDLRENAPEQVAWRILHRRNRLACNQSDDDLNSQQPA
jgi:lauroyl/myristoyl acyltransferase